MTTISFKPHQAGRKQLADTMASSLGVKAEYLGTPSFVYQIGDAILDRDWVLHLPDSIDFDEVIEAAKAAGFTLANTNRDGDGGDGGQVGLTLAFPTEGWGEATESKMGAMLASKGALIATALGIPAAPMRVDEEAGRVEFPWFTLVPDAQTVEAVSVLIAAMIKRAKTATRISPTPPAPGNDKYAMRCWLLRLGMIGEGYANTRRLLLANLEGNAAWKTLPTPEGES